MHAHSPCESQVQSISILFKSTWHTVMVQYSSSEYLKDILCMNKKKVPFKRVWCKVKVLPWDTLWSFISNQKTKSKVPKRNKSFRKFGKWKVWFLVSLIPLEIKFHTVPHFKALKYFEDIHGGQGSLIYFQITFILNPNAEGSSCKSAGFIVHTSTKLKSRND